MIKHIFSINKKIKSEAFTRIEKIIFLVGIILLIGLVILVGYFYKINTDQKNNILAIQSEAKNLKADLESLNLKYVDILSQIEISEKDKTSLMQALSQVGVEYSSLMQNYNTKITEVDKLQKTVLIDDELLKKYSKYYFLNENYVPSSTSVIDSSYAFNKKEISILTEVKPKLEQMIIDARSSNINNANNNISNNTGSSSGNTNNNPNKINLVVNSGYRSFKEQKGLKSVYVQKYGLTKSNQFSADQGYSEHQLGTAVDLSNNNPDLSISFDKTGTFAWLKDNSYKYGFILSYPKGNSYYMYEPWHYRFVGVELATYLHTNSLNFYDLDQKFIDGYKVKIFE